MVDLQESSTSILDNSLCAVFAIGLGRLAWRQCPNVNSFADFAACEDVFVPFNDPPAHVGRELGLMISRRDVRAAIGRREDGMQLAGSTET